MSKWCAVVAFVATNPDGRSVIVPAGTTFTILCEGPPVESFEERHTREKREGCLCQPDYSGSSFDRMVDSIIFHDNCPLHGRAARERHTHG